MNIEFLSLFNVFCIVVLPYAIWYFVRLKTVMPCAVVQISVGIALGPSLLGAVAPVFHEQLLPGAIRAQVNGISALSILFFALITGLHMDLRQFRGRHGGFALVGFGSIFCPFCLGAAAAWWIYWTHPAIAQDVGGEAAFVLSTAIALSVTALPVLGAILRELELISLPIGQWSLGLAAMNDATLWFLLSALLAGFSRGGAPGMSTLASLLFGALYIGGMYGVARPLLRRLLGDKTGAASGDSLLIVVTALALISAAMTELLGFHYLLGAFVAGTVLPEEIRRAVLDRLERAIVFLLTPFFFIATGLRVTVDISSADFMQAFAITTAAAIVGKFVGTAVPARGIGLSWRDSVTLGSLMQAKGMMELAVLSILQDSGLISNAMFSALTVMAVATTAIAMPMSKLSLCLFRHPLNATWNVVHWASAGLRPVPGSKIDGGH